jgi:LuxR family maltose regulon positive regulatory protein
MAFAKTTRPTLARTLARPRLFRRLDRAGQRPVTWVWSPPGAGKTTAVASYLAARRQRVLWYQLDEGDADVATFFYYLGRAAPRRRRPLPLLTSEYRQGLAVFARRFFRELYARLATLRTVVFDNYQEVPPGAELHQVMREAIEEIPKGARVIFISRSEPPPAFARALAHEAIAVLDWSELRFTPTEARALTRARASGRWAPATLRALYERTEGWCAGLILLHDQLRNDVRGLSGLSGSSPEVLFDYFAGEIFKRADPAVQDVLLQTSFLPSVTAAMAEALTGQATAGETLAALHKQNYFTNKQAGNPPTYEYHPLFREFLLARATHSYSRDTQAKIRRAAAALLDAAGRIEAAAALLRDAGDWSGLAQLIHRHGSTLLGQGRGQTIEEWLGYLPPAIFEEQPWLLFWRGMGWLAWRHTECQRALEQAFAAFRRQGDAIGIFLAWSGVIYAYASEGESIPLDRWIAILDEIKEASPFPSKGIETRVAAAMLVALVCRNPGHPEAASWARRAIELARHHPDPALRTTTVFFWAQYQWVFGDFSGVEAAANEMRALMHARESSPVVAVNASMTVVWYEAAKALPSYRRTVAEMLELAQTTGMFYTARHVALGGGLMAALSDGDLATAGSWLRELERDVHLLGPGFRYWHYWFIVWEALVRNDGARAASYQPEMLRLAQAAGRPADEAVAHLMSAQALHARGETPDAFAHVEHALTIASTARSAYLEFMARLTEAHLSFDAGREADAVHALRTAMALGRQHGYVTSHVWIPAVMARLCAHALDAGIEPDYVGLLVQTRRLVPDDPPAGVEGWPWPVRVFTLGRFEVLRHGEPVRFARKVQRRPLALLKALIAFGGRGVREDLVMDAFWPDAAGDAAHRALTSALHRLRGLLGHEGAILRQDGHLSLDARSCWVDIWAVEHVLAHKDTDAGHERDLRVAVDLYRGPFLEGEESALPQAAALALSLRRRLVRHVAAVARQWESTDGPKAADWYEECLRVDPCAEDIARSLMTVYHKLGRRAAVLDVYGRCQAALAARLGSTPSPETERLFRALRPA